MHPGRRPLCGLDLGWLASGLWPVEANASQSGVRVAWNAAIGYRLKSRCAEVVFGRRILIRLSLDIVVVGNGGVETACCCDPDSVSIFCDERSNGFSVANFIGDQLLT